MVQWGRKKKRRSRRRAIDKFHQKAILRNEKKYKVRKKGHSFSILVKTGYGIYKEREKKESRKAYRQKNFPVLTAFCANWKNGRKQVPKKTPAFLVLLLRKKKKGKKQIGRPSKRRFYRNSVLRIPPELMNKRVLRIGNNGFLFSSSQTTSFTFER